MPTCAVVRSTIAGLGGGPHLLLGDLNALHRADYTSERWQEIHDVRAAGSWELPRTSLTNWLLSPGAATGGDGGSVSEGGAGYVDARVCGTARVDTAVEPTCHYGTRIDYILLGTPVGGTGAGAEAVVEAGSGDAGRPPVARSVGHAAASHSRSALCTQTHRRALNMH
jgi:hypothetical protein